MKIDKNRRIWPAIKKQYQYETQQFSTLHKFLDLLLFGCMLLMLICTFI